MNTSREPNVWQSYNCNIPNPHTSPVAGLWNPPPHPSPALPPHSSFPIPLTGDWWLWAPSRMRSKLEGGERSRHERKWKRREPLLSCNQRGYGERPTGAAKTTWWKKQSSPLLTNSFYLDKKNYYNKNLRTFKQDPTEMSSIRTFKPGCPLKYSLSNMNKINQKAFATHAKHKWSWWHSIQKKTEKRLFYSLGGPILILVAATFAGKRKTC